MKLLKLPGLIDIHTHLRTPGQTNKEDFATGTKAAIHGGFTTIVDMPNNLKPIITEEFLDEKISLAEKNIIGNVGFYFGSLGDNLKEFNKVQKKVLGLKLYLNQTTGNFLIGKDELDRIFLSWESNQPILLHAEVDVLDTVFNIIKKHKRKAHICHVSSEIELSKIIKAKDKGLNITCGVTPHHLFLSNEDEKDLGPFGLMKPFLKSKKDVQFLWRHLHDIDLIESDHAPHTRAEKIKKTSPFGVPGLETTLPLILSAFKKGRLNIGDIIRLCNTNPLKVLNLKKSENTYIEVLMEEFKLEGEQLFTKCKWSPFEGKNIYGKVVNVVIDSKKVMENGKIIAKKGSGKIIFPV